MNYIISQIPNNAFLKVNINQTTRKIYFNDVKMYKKIIKKTYPPLPNYPIDRTNKEREDNTDEDNN